MLYVGQVYHKPKKKPWSFPGRGPPHRVIPSQQAVVTSTAASKIEAGVLEQKTI